jgi:toxin FitB
VRGWLLDTNVVSELRRPKPNSAVSEFVAAQPGEVLFTTEVTFDGEIRFGIEQLEDAGRRSDIHMWLNRTLRPLFFGRVLAITEDVIVRWKTMAVERQKGRQTFGQPDLFVAAIAALEDLVVVTRDTGEFVAAEVPVFDPWSSTLHVRGQEAN